jgi:hypothetical protein
VYYPQTTPADPNYLCNVFYMIAILFDIKTIQRKKKSNGKIPLSIKWLHTELSFGEFFHFRSF